MAAWQGGGVGGTKGFANISFAVFRSSGFENISLSLKTQSWGQQGRATLEEILFTSTWNEKLYLMRIELSFNAWKCIVSGEYCERMVGGGEGGIDQWRD